MIRKKYKTSSGGMTIAVLIFMNALLLKAGYLENPKYYPALIVALPLLAFAIWDGMNGSRRNSGNAV